MSPSTNEVAHDGDADRRVLLLQFLVEGDRRLWPVVSKSSIGISSGDRTCRVGVSRIASERIAVRAQIPFVEDGARAGRVSAMIRATCCRSMARSSSSIAASVRLSLSSSKVTSSERMLGPAQRDTAHFQRRYQTHAEQHDDEQRDGYPSHDAYSPFSGRIRLISSAA